MSKICTACENSKGKKSIVKKRASWVKKMGRKHHPPLTYLPNPANLMSLKINMGKNYAHRYIYYFAAESQYMLQYDQKPIQNVIPSQAYDDFENNGVAKLDSQGRANIVLSRPINYFVTEDGQTYIPHVHYKVSSKDGKKWLQQNYTIQI